MKNNYLDYSDGAILGSTRTFVLFNLFGIVSLSLLIGVVSSVTFAYANSLTDEINVTVDSSCTMTGGTDGTSTSGTSTYSINIAPSTFEEVNGSKLAAVCNDAAGYSIYAIGYSGNSYDAATHTSMISNESTIPTNTNTSGNTSGWAMMVNQVTAGDPAIMNNFDSAYQPIPGAYTQVVKYTAPTASVTSTGAAVQTKYRIYVSGSQPAGAYTGKVKYTMVHPNNAVAPVPPFIDDLTYLQDFDNLSAAEKTAVLNSMEYNTTYNLIDNRDNQVYPVAKLRDGNVWMATNLNLGDIDNHPLVVAQLDSTNTHFAGTDVSKTVDAATFGGWKKTGSSGAFATAELIPISGTDSVSQTPYGVLYNYCAASAGTYCYASGSGTGDATSDVCPAGWRLPTGGSSGEFKTLANIASYDTGTKIRSPISNGGAAFALAGYFFTNSTPLNQGSDGAYWSSTRSDGSFMHRLSLSTLGISPTSFTYRDNGSSIRCVVSD